MSIVNVSVGVDGLSANGASYAPVFSPDGSKVAFLSNASNLVNDDFNNVMDIFIKDLQTGQIERIANNGVDLLPSTELQFSPDGLVLLFSVNGQIYEATVQSGINPTPFQGDNVTFSPNGLLAFDLNGEISVLGRGIVAQGQRPVFSPDSQRLAFNDTIGGLSVVDLSTGLSTQIAPNVIGVSYPASFSPDGSKIAFFTMSNYVAQDTHNSADVYVYDFASQQMTL
ncbi:MAG: PD40 domain-containing protein, partial [Pseudomonadales bacterium]|nr:PD40 domain-containing protein [Pseudomonadales bacterium]